MTPKRRVVDCRFLIDNSASWIKSILSVSPIAPALCCLGYYAYAKGILPPDVALTTFWVVFVVSIGPRTSMLKLLRAVLGALLDSLN